MLLRGGWFRLMQLAMVLLFFYLNSFGDMLVGLVLLVETVTGVCIVERPCIDTLCTRGRVVYFVRPVPVAFRFRTHGAGCDATRQQSRCDSLPRVAFRGSWSISRVRLVAQEGVETRYNSRKRLSATRKRRKWRDTRLEWRPRCRNAIG
jgi:hypothetical protein